MIQIIRSEEEQQVEVGSIPDGSFFWYSNGLYLKLGINQANSEFRTHVMWFGPGLSAGKLSVIYKTTKVRLAHDVTITVSK